MKKIIFLSVFALLSAFVTLESCKKSEAVDASNGSSAKSEQFYDGDEYDKGIITEDSEKELEDIIDYDKDAVSKIDSIVTQGDVKYSDLYTDAACADFKYKTYNLMPDNQNWYRYSIYLNNETDSITDVTANQNTKIDAVGSVKRIERFLDNRKRWAVYCQTNSAIAIKKANIKFTVTLADGKSKARTVKCVGVISNISENTTNGDEDNEYYEYAYGTSRYTAMEERRKLNKVGIGQSNTRQDITSSYIPQLGDVLFFGEMPAVIISTPVSVAATRTKQARLKFKIVESNTKCNNKRYLKSVAMTDPTQITSADGITKATKYFRN